MKDLIATRYMVAFMTMMGLVVIYPQRGNLSVAIVAMVGSSAHHNESIFSNETEFTQDTCPYPTVSKNDTELDTEMVRELFLGSRDQVLRNQLWASRSNTF